MSENNFTKILDVRGLSCPLPLVKARKEISMLDAGETLKVLCSDRASIADFQGWSQTAKDVHLLKQETIEEEGKPVFIHYLQLKSK